MDGGNFKLDNLCAVVDRNRLQIDGWTKDVKCLKPLRKKFEAFGWHVITLDGHNIEELLKAFEEAEKTKNIPTIIIANTVKGKGVSFMENQVGWHGKAPNKEEAEIALKELGE